MDLFHRTLEVLSPVLRDLLTVQYLAGMRSGEACLMRLCDIDGRTPWGTTFPGLYCYVPERHKTQHHGAERIIFLGEKAQAILLNYAIRPDRERIFSPRDAVAFYKARHGHDFTTTGKRAPGAEYTHHSVSHAVQRACLRAFPLPGHLAKLPHERKDHWQARLTDAQKEEVKKWRADHHWHPHQLRHARATEIRAKYGPDAARVVLGHALSGVTGLYAGIPYEIAAQVMREMG